MKIVKLLRWKDAVFLPQFEQILWKDALLFLSTNQLGPQGFLRYLELSLGCLSLPANPEEHTRKIYPILQHFTDLSDTLEYLRIPQKALAASLIVEWSHRSPLTVKDAYTRAHIHSVNLHWEMLILACIPLQVPTHGATLLDHRPFEIVTAHELL